MAVDGSNGKGGTRGESVLITGAQRPYDEQLRSRIRKYTIMMAIRIPALIIAAIVYSATRNPWLPLGIIALSIPLPWMAVLIANDSPAGKPEEINRYRYGDGAGRPAIEPAHRNVIDQ